MRILTFGLAGQVMGGIESFLINMGKHMKEECTFDYVIIGEDTIHRKAIEEQRGHVFCVTSYNKSLFKNIRETWHVLKENKSTNSIAYFNVFSMVHMFPVILCKLNGYKVVIHAHNNNLQQKSKLYRLLHNFNRWLFKDMNCLRLTTSDASTEFMFGEKHIEDTELVYNAIEVDRFKYNSKSRQRIRESLGINDKYVLGFSGRLSIQKNPLFVIDIFEKFYSINPESVLLMAGEGELRRDIEKRIKENGMEDYVILLGARKDIEDVYQAMDLFLLPSLFEGLGIVLIEAQASGLPCITTEKTVPDLVNVTELVSRANLNEGEKVWAKKINELRNEQFQTRDVYSEHIKNSNFNIEKEAKRLLNIFYKYENNRLL